MRYCSEGYVVPSNPEKYAEWEANRDYVFIHPYILSEEEYILDVKNRNILKLLAKELKCKEDKVLDVIQKNETGYFLLEG